MKLYFAPDTCSLSPHIVLRELDLPFELIRINNRTKRSADGGDFYRVNPKGYVAALMLDDGQVITEGTAIVQYLTDLRPEAGLAPPNSTFERVRLQEWLNFITSEIHAGSSPLFNSTLTEEVKMLFRDKLRRRLDFVAQTLDEPAFLLGETFSVADAYLFTVLRWMDQFSIDLKYWPSITRYMSLISQRRSVQTALAAEAASQAVP